MTSPTSDSDQRVTIGSSALSAVIDPLGAELIHLRDVAGAELMTDADPAFWTGHAPILFPIVGALAGGRYRIDGAEYQLPQHGFARRRRFALASATGDAATFRLTDDEETRLAYPFAFVLEVAYRIDDAMLTVTAMVGNPGACELPASIGFHPAFAWPLPYGQARADHRIVFAADEPDPLPRLQGGLVGPADRPSPLDGRTLALDDALFTDDALIWPAVRSDRVRYGAADGPLLDIAFPDTPMLGIWSKPGAAFVCIEPWHGHADPVGFAGELRDKPGILRIAPGASRTATMRVTLVR